MKARWLIVTKKYMTPDLLMSRDEIEKIVRKAAPKGYAELGLDRLLTTAQMVEEYRQCDLRWEELCALLPYFAYFYTGTRRKIDTYRFEWMELIDFHAVANMIRKQAPRVLESLGLERVCTVKRMGDEFLKGNIALEEFARLYVHYDMGIYTIPEQVTAIDSIIPPEEGDPFYDFDLIVFPLGVYDKVLEAIQRVEEEG
jgi:hypothetical protein